MIGEAPRRASVSAIRRPETAVMLAATSGMVAPLPSSVDRSTSSREPTEDLEGTMKTSLYVRSCPGCWESLRNRTSPSVPENPAQVPNGAVHEVLSPNAANMMSAILSAISSAGSWTSALIR